MKKYTGYTEVLRHENEITKLKIQAEFGVELKGNSDLNPALENVWLNKILEYERAMSNNAKITIHEKLGSPVIREVTEILDEDMVDELHALMSDMHKHSIVVESCAGIEDREMYRFITEELFHHPIESETPANMITCFIYEEFHPNDEYDIVRYSKEFVEMFTQKGENYWKMHLSPAEESEENEVRAANLERRLSCFRDAFDEIRLDEFGISKINIKDDYAEVDFDFKFDVRPQGKKFFNPITGPGKFVFSKEIGYWFISDIKMEGIVS